MSVRGWLQGSRPITTARLLQPIEGPPRAQRTPPDDERLPRLQPTPVDAPTAPRDKCPWRQGFGHFRQESAPIPFAPPVTSATRLSNLGSLTGAEGIIG